MSKRVLIFISLLLCYVPYSGTTQSITSIDTLNGLFFTVNLGITDSEDIPSEFKVFSQINIEKVNANSTRFSNGLYTTLGKAKSRKSEIVQMGFEEASVMAYFNGKRIELTEANSSTNLAEVDKPTIKSNENTPYFKAFQEVSDLIEKEIIDYSTPEGIHDTLMVSNLFDLQIDSFTTYIYDSTYNRALIQQLKGDPGFNFNAWYLHNFEPGFFENEDLAYFDRLNLTMNWDLLRGGMLENKLKAKQLENQLSINKLRHQELSSIDRYENTYNYIIYIFNKEKLKILDQRIQLLRKQYQIHEILYSSKEKSWEEMLAIKAQISRADNMHRKWSNYNRIIEDVIFAGKDSFTSIEASALPLLEIIPDSLFKNTLEDDIDYETLIHLMGENVDLEYNRWKDWNLRPFARYNLIGQNTPFDRNYGSIGLNLTMPIRMKGYQEVAEAKKMSLKEGTFKKENNDNHELLNYFYEYEYKLEQAIEFHYKTFRIEEKLRKEVIKYQLGDINFHPITSIGYIDELIAVKLELLDIKQQLYLKTLKISEYLSSPSPLSYSKIIQPKKLSYKYNQERHIYLWSKFFEQQDNLFLIHYLQVNEIKTVILSPGNTPDEEKIIDFVFLANKYNIEVQGLVGNNKLAIKPDNKVLSDYLNKFLDYGFSGIHFDIEPQTFPDWETNQKTYTDNMVNCFEQIRNQLTDSDFKINCSISMFYPEFSFEGFKKSCDYIYIMAYETPEIEFISRKTKEERDFFENQLILSIRTKDFQNRLKFESFMSELSQNMKLKQVAIHDLGTLFDLDNISSLKD